ncbi:hypothetical protein [Alteromonas sp. CYL-A6]|uniref:hypothetical protein n=1 Tax=Alteromonas nitratireducens TaxID=3390813 RepID=UPI0034B22C66
MSTGSGFSFTVSPAPWRRYLPLMPCVALVFACAGLPEMTLTYISTAWLWSGCLTVVTACSAWALLTREVRPRRWRVNQSGWLRYHNNHCVHGVSDWYRVAPASRITSWGLYVSLTGAESPQRDVSLSFWLFPGEVREQHFRRLSRMILHSTHH